MPALFGDDTEVKLIIVRRLNADAAMDEIDSLIAALREAGGDVWIAGQQSEVAIVELERTIGVTLPPSYREFLGRFGGFGIVDSFIYRHWQGDN